MNHAQFYHHTNSNQAIVNNNNNNNLSSPLKINKASHHIKKSLSNSLPSSSSSSSLYNTVAATTSTTIIPHQQQQQQQQQRQPVIIYTHSPKVIHTHPRDFKALVQKLTGLSPEEVSSSPQSMPMPQYHPKSEPINGEMDHDHDTIIGAESCFGDEQNNYHRNNMTNINTNINEKCDLLMNDDNDSVVTDENNEFNGSSCIGDNNSSASCYVPRNPIFDLPIINDYKDTNNNDFSNYNYNNNMNSLSDSPSFFDTNFTPFDPNPITNSSDYFFSDQQLSNYTDSLFSMPSMRNSFSSSSSESIKELPDF